ncbi:hypothetical protein B0H11DRAFT_1788829 [Mycena galericulata]|nr:hypothetical protein B0H11DRAFT_1788829 [Mycena galericulata]
MHRTLAIPEVVSLVFEEVASPPPGLPSPADRPYGAVGLARLARTCRAFSDPALDLLWKSQYTIIPLLRCFPPHLWEITGSGTPDDPKIFRFRSSIKHSDCARVLSYSFRIREITLGHDLTGLPKDLPLPVLEVLNVLGVGCLLPNVQHLGWSPNDPTVFPSITLFLGSALSSVHLTVLPTLPHLSLLSHLAAKFPTLQKVSISEPTSAVVNATIVLAVSSLVLAMTNAKEVRVPYLHAEAYLHLASLTSLEILEVDALYGVSSPKLGAPPHPSFQSLRDLNLRSCTIEGATDLVTMFSNPPLESLYLVVSASPSASTMQAFFTTLADHASHSHLTHLDVHIGESLDPVSYSGTLLVLPPLLTFHNLRYVSLELPFGMAIDDSWCSSLAFPHLEELVLEPRGSPPSTVRLAALVAFARNCPVLRELTLPVDATDTAALTLPLQPRVRQTNLRRVWFPDSPIRSAPPVARFLSSLFPCIDRLNAFAPEENWSLLWDQVAELLPVLTDVRAEVEVYWTSRAEALNS